MVLSTLRRLVRCCVPLASLALLLTGCIGTQPPLRLAEPTPIAVLVRLTGADGAPFAVPDAAQAALREELVARNFVVETLDAEPLGSSISKIETPQGKLGAMIQAAPGARWVLLVETSARFFSQLSGRFRWDVDARLTLARTAALGEARHVDVGVAAFLHHDHEREPEALTFVRRQLVSELQAMLERMVGAGEPAGASTPEP